MMYSKKRNLFKKCIIYLTLITVTVFTVWISLLQYQPPKVVSNDADSSQFSAERAMGYLEEIAREPRPLGSEAHSRVGDYLISTLKSFGLTPEIQEQWVSNAASWGYAYEGPVKNIVARIPGEDSSAAIMITAHYDSVDGSPGAGDDGSGVAAMLETARILTSGATLKNDVIILFSDAEEVGLLGAQIFADEHPWAQEVGIVVNFEARGNKGPAVLFETSDGNDRIVTLYGSVVPNATANSLYYEIYQYLVNDTDLSVYKSAGMHGMNIGLIEGGNSYHSASDTTDQLSMNSLQHIGDTMLSLINHMGYMDLVDKQEGNRVYFNLIGNKIVSYLDKWVMPLMVVSIISFLITFVHGYVRRKVTIAGTCGGLLLFLLTIGSAYLIGQGLYQFILDMYADQLWENTSISRIIFIGLITILFIYISIVYWLASKKIKTGNLAMGALIVWLVLVIVSSMYFVGASYIFVWPFMIGLIGINVFLLLKQRQSIMGLIVNIGIQIPALMIVAPTVYIIYVFWNLEAMAILSVSIALASAFMIPVLSTGNRKKKSKKTSRIKKYQK